MNISAALDGTPFLFTGVVSSDVLSISVDLLGGKFGWGIPSGGSRYVGRLLKMI